MSINDGEWHFICAAWISENGFYEIYLDGRIHQTGFNLSAGSSIEPYGTLIIGQDQDEVGSSFSETESYVGKISYLDIWDEFLPAHQIEHMFTTCEPYQGNLYAWSDFKTKIKGSLKVCQYSHLCELFIIKVPYIFSGILVEVLSKLYFSTVTKRFNI